jgi:hypothetical protein
LPKATPRSDSVHPSLPGIDEQNRIFCQSSLSFFAAEVLSGPPEPPYNGRFLVAEHHEEWDELIMQHRRICCLAPRDHGKSYFFNFAYPIWKSVYTPNGAGYIFSVTQPQAEQILDKIKTEIETNPKLQHLVPKKKSLWSTRSIKLSNGHRIYARGFGTKVRGAHPSWVVVDDGLNDESMYSETVRKKQIDYFFSAITNMLVPGGQLIVVGTPFHAADLYATLAENDQYTFRRYPALLPNGKPLWSDRYNLDLLKAKQKEIGTIRFAREFECQPVSDAMSLFPGYLFEGDPTEQFMVKLGMPLSFWKQLGIQIYMGVDFALSSSVSADYFIAWVMGKDRFGNRWVVDVFREKGLPYHRQLSVINTLARRYQPGLIFLEANQMQRIFGDELIRKTDLPIHKFVTTAQEKNSLEKGVPGLRTLLENHKIRIPRGDAKSVELMNVWKQEMQAFTWVDGKLQGLGAHDDTVMAFWICNQAINQGAFEFTFGSEEDLALQEGDEVDLLKELTGMTAEQLDKKDADKLEGKYQLGSGDDGDDEVLAIDDLSQEDRAALDAVLEEMKPKPKVSVAALAEALATAGKRKVPPKRTPVRDAPEQTVVPSPPNLIDDGYMLGQDPFQFSELAVP